MIAYTLIKEISKDKNVFLKTIDRWDMPIWGDGDDHDSAMFFTNKTIAMAFAKKHEALMATFRGSTDGKKFYPEEYIGRFDPCKFDVNEN